MSFLCKNKFKLLIALTLVLVLSLTIIAACKTNHKCQHVCDKCGGCLTDCEDENCSGKCPGHDSPIEPHYCRHACDICGKCQNPSCKDPVCAEKCTGEHEPAMYVNVGNVRVGLLSDTVVRIEQRGAKGFENRKTYLVSNRNDWNVPEHTETTQYGETVITTKNYTVKIPQNATNLNNARVYSADGELIWQYGGQTTSNVYLPSPSDELSSWYFTDSPRVVPSDYGYSYEQNVNSDPLQGWDFDNDAPDCYVFLPQGDYKKFCNDYVNLTGSSEMVSLQMLGYWDSRWFAYDEQTALQQIKDYTDRGYSLDVLVIDTDWHSSNGIGGVGYQVNTELFPNMSKFLDECHELGVNVMFNDHPQPVPGTDNVLDNEEVQYRNQKLTMILSMGLDYWWYDRNWSVALNNADPDISVYAFGMYAYQFVTNEYLESITDIGEYAERALIMANVDGCLHGKWDYASDISAHRYSIQWTGDINTDTTALAQEIYATVFGGAEVGLPYMSSDLGGHTASVSADMYVRWLQYGALSTICRVHCTDVNVIGQDGRMPWLFGEEAEEIVHEYVDMRYRLLPLYYSLARENYDTGLPIMRRTDIEYPQYNEASRNDQYMLGENVLVAPYDSAENLQIVPSDWLKASNGQKGLDAKYYTDTNFSSLTASKVDSEIDFNWENGGPFNMSDNFSVRWEGKITFGGRDARLVAFADDGVRVFVDGEKVIDGWQVYDTLKYSGYYEAGTTHDIKVEYREDYGGAHCYLYYGERTEDGKMLPNTRTVFIPDGTWIDVWTGERFKGPQTITVSHGLQTSPIFVREGSVFALAENMKNTSEKDWSNMALDIYAGTTPTSTVLYEDDTTTQAYKYGKYRTTLITNEYENNRYTVTVNPAQGRFDGARAFEERNWTVRIHMPQGYGAITGLFVNGAPYNEFSTFSQSSNSSPFAFSGAALDGDVCEFVLNDCSVYEELVISFAFTSEINEIEAPEYDDSASSVNVTVENEVGDLVNLTQVGEIDWIHYGVDDVKTAIRKNIQTHYIGDLIAYSNCQLLQSNVYGVWTDGDGAKTSSVVGEVNGGLISYKSFELTFKVDSTKRYYVLNLGGERCIAKLTVRDRAGNAQTSNMGNLYGKFANRVIIEASSENETEIQVIYSVLVSRPNGTDSYSRVNISSVYVTNEVKEVENIGQSLLTATVGAPKTVPSTANLSSTTVEGMVVADWRHFGSTDSAAYIEKAGADIIKKSTFTNGGLFYDYQTVISWTDGDVLESEAGSKNGTCGGLIELTFTIGKKSKIILYTGAWKGNNGIEVKDLKGNVIGRSQTFSAGENSQNRIVEIDVDSPVETIVTIQIRYDGNSGGNVSLAAVQVLQEAE